MIPSTPVPSRLPSPGAVPRSWLGDLAGGVSGVLVALPVIIVQGLLAYAALGPAGAAVGLPAAFVAVLVGSPVFMLLWRMAQAEVSPSSATTLILSAWIAQLVQAWPGAQGSSPGDVATLVLLAGLPVAGMGLLQLLMARLGLARLARDVPQPVLAGFLNGVALLILVSQLAPLLGWPLSGGAGAAAWTEAASWAQTRPGALLAGVVTLAVALLLRRWRPAWPGALLGLAAGAGLGLGLGALWPPLEAGPQLGALPPVWMHLPTPALWAQVLGDAAWRPLLPGLLSTMVVLAMIGSLETVLNALAVDQVARSRSDPGQLLRAVGWANLLSGLCGGLPLVMLRLRALASLRGGAHSPRAPLWGWALMLVLAVSGGGLLAPLPLAVFAGAMVGNALGLFDGWSLQLLARWWRGERDLQTGLNLAVVLSVCVATVAFGFTVGVLLGVVLAMGVFIRGMRQSLIRQRQTAQQQPSRRHHAPGDEAWLAGQRQRIAVWELQGALFFGSTEHLVDATAMLPADTHTLVLCLRRVSVVDASGAVSLAQLRHRLAERGVDLRLAGFAADGPVGRALHSFGAAELLQEPGPAVDIDHAVEAAEWALLAEARRAPAAGAELPLAQTVLAAGLEAAECRRLQALLQRRTLAAGECLFRRGEAADGLCVVLAGSVSLVSPQAGGHRFASLSPGMLFGELAVLDGGGRSSDAVADAATVLAWLDRAALERLEADDPALAARLYCNIARHLATRLRIASQAWQASLG